MAGFNFTSIQRNAIKIVLNDQWHLSRLSVLHTCIGAWLVRLGSDHGNAIWKMNIPRSNLEFESRE